MSKRSKTLIAGVVILAATAAATIVYGRIGAEAVVASFYRNLADQNFSDEGKAKISTLECSESSEQPSIFSDRVFECRVETLCGIQIVSQFRYDFLGGASLSPDRFFERFARVCPEMLNKNNLNQAETSLDQGG